MSPDDLLTSAEVAHLYRVDQSTVRRWARTGELPYVRLPGGGSIRYRRSDIERFTAPRAEVTQP